MGSIKKESLVVEREGGQGSIFRFHEFLDFAFLESRKIVYCVSPSLPKLTCLAAESSALSRVK